MDKQEFKTLCGVILRLNLCREHDTEIANAVIDVDPVLAGKMHAYIDARSDMAEYVRSRMGDGS